jgi:ribosome-associated protein
LLDYFDIIVHVFSEEKREFFALEKLWGDGEIEVHASENIII